VPLPVWPNLPARSVPLLDRYARLVARQLDVPMALVSLVGNGGQVSPGAVGLPEPWATERSVPLTHSLCQHVVADGRPLFVEQTAAHPLLKGNGAVTEWGVTAYGGAPLTDRAGTAVGALSAIDIRPRRWQPRDIELLVELAELCSAQVDLEIAVETAREEHAAAERAMAQARSAEARARTAVATATTTLQHHRRLRLVADVLARVTAATDLTSAVSRLSRDCLGVDHVLIGVTREPVTELRVLPLRHQVRGRRHGSTVIPLADDSPIRVAVREQRAVGLPPTCAGLAASTCSSRVDLPLLLSAPHLGVLSLRWARPQNVGEQADILEALARHTAWAVQRTVLSEWW
jgi:GAF domain